MRQSRWTAIVFLALLVLSLPLSAQPNRPTGIPQAGEPRESTIQFAERPTAVALQELVLFRTEPKKLWFFTTNPEGKLGTIPKDGTVRIEETKYVNTLLERSVWLRVSLEPNQNLGTAPLTGWVYAGKVEGDQFVVSVAEKR